MQCNLNRGFAKILVSFVCQTNWVSDFEELVCFSNIYRGCCSATCTWHSGKILCTAAAAYTPLSPNHEWGLFDGFFFFFIIIILYNSVELNMWVFLKAITMHTIEQKEQQRSCRQRGVYVESHWVISLLRV